MTGHLARLLAAGTLAALALLLAGAGSATAAHPVTLTGRLTDSSGNGIANVNVSAYTGGPGAVCCTWVTGVNTDGGGNYALTLAHGTYRLQFYPPASSAFVSRWFSDAGTARLFDQATDIDLTSDTTLPGTALETGFFISGTVTGAAGAPLAGVNVSAYTAGSCCAWVAAGVTSATGTYSLRVPVASYRLQFYPPQTTSYIAEWWDGASGGRSFDSGVDIAVAADVSGKDALLTLGRRLSGTVTSGGAAVAGANASLFAGGAAAGCCTWITGSSTDAAGAFSLIVPDGTYRLALHGPSGASLISEWWDGPAGSGVGRFEQASDIVVSGDQAGFDAALTAGWRISGRVTSDGVTGIAGAGVGAFTGGASAFCCTWAAGSGTDAGGNYSLVVPAGTYRVQFHSPQASTYISEWWNGGAGVARFDQALDVTVGSNLTMHAELAAGVRVSGRVTAADGSGIARAGVGAFVGGTSAFCCTWLSGAGTDSQGDYSIVLPAGTYRFYYSAPRESPYIGEWWNGAAGTTHFDQASDVTVAAAITGQNVQLTSGIRITGRVSSAGGPIANAGVSAYAGGASATCCTWAAGAGTDALGDYTLVVPAGTYRLQFHPPRGSSFVGEWWNGGAGVSRFDQAADVAALADVAGRDALLETGLRISGRVSSDAANPTTSGIANVGVGAFSGGAGATCCTWSAGTGTDASGSYTLVVPAGIYRLQFYPPRSSSFIGEWWDGGAGASRFDQAADIGVAADVGGRDATLGTGLRITGRVTSGGSGGVAGVGVSAFIGGSGATCCTWVSGTGTDGLGNYTLVVPAGTYRLQFYPPHGSSLMSQWWTAAGGATGFHAAQDIGVSADVAGKDAVLGSGLRITGRVTSGGVGLAGVGVNAFTGGSGATCCTWISGAGTDGSGSYTLVVPPGTYRLQFWPPRGSSVLGQWSGGASRFDLAADVAVAAHVTVPDVALQSGFRISGRVTDGGGAGIANANVSAYLGGGATCCSWVNGTGTDSDGSYTLALPAGTYRLQIHAPHGSSYLSEWWTSGAGTSGFAAAEDITIGGADVPGRNATLAAGIVIRGTVRNESAAPLQGVWVLAMVCGGSCTSVAGASTGADGVYRLSVPPNGTYKLSFNPPQGSPYVGEWYQDATGPSTAADVVVGTTSPTDKDATLAVGVAITGTVRSAAGVLANANVSAFVCGGTCTWIAGANTATNGTYRLVVPSGTYLINVNPPPGSSYIGEWYQDAATFQAATPVVVGSADRLLDDITLATGFAISGRVSSDAANPTTSGIQGASVSVVVCDGAFTSCSGVTGTGTASDGTYRVVVSPGTYRIHVRAPDGSNYVNEWYQDAATAPAALAVDATTSDRALDNVILATGFAITGTVNGPSGALADVNVTAHVCGGGSCTFAAGTRTGPDGRYRLVAPNGGTYKVQFSAPGHVTQWHANQPGPGTATGLSTATTGVNATLAATTP